MQWGGNVVGSTITPYHERSAPAPNDPDAKDAAEELEFDTSGKKNGKIRPLRAHDARSCPAGPRRCDRPRRVVGRGGRGAVPARRGRVLPQERDNGEATVMP